MKFSAATVAVLATAAYAQLEGFPSCATSCLASFTSGNNVAGCKPLDYDCVCSNKTFIEGIACCVTKACDEKTQQTILQAAKGLCAGTKNSQVPDKVVCNAASGSAPASSGAASSTPAASTPAASGSAPASSGSAPASSGSAPASTPATTGSPAATTPATSGANTASGNTPAPTSTSKGGAATVGGLTGIAGAVVGMLLAL